METPFDVEALPATFGAVVTGLTVPTLSDDHFAALYRTWLDYALLILPGQHLDPAQQVAFARRFGDLEIESAPISNVRADGSVRDPAGDDDVLKVLKGNMFWHQDSTYMPVQAKGAVFSAQVTPDEGGETGWADMRAAYDALDAKTRAIVDGASACHSLHYSQSKVGHRHTEASTYSGYGFQVKDPPRRPLMKVHPETGRRTLAIGRHAYDVTGMSAEEGERFLAELTAFACQPPRVWQHNWTPGDVVIWDNRCLMHRALPWDLTLPRVMRHSRIAGDPVTEFAAAG